MARAGSWAHRWHLRAVSSIHKATEKCSINDSTTSLGGKLSRASHLLVLQSVHIEDHMYKSALYQHHRDRFPTLTVVAAGKGKTA